MDRLYPTKTLARLSDNQKHALDLDRNLAVRANAGSGKTTVLVERAVQVLARGFAAGEDVSLTSLVVITFTRKAAGQLRTKLRDALLTLAELAGSPTERRFWMTQAELVPYAMIGTIDGLCSSILHEFSGVAPFDLGITPGFEPLEGFDESSLKAEAVDRAINRIRLEETEPSLCEALDWWAEKEGYGALAAHLTGLLSHSVEPRQIAKAAATRLPREAWVQWQWENVPAVKQLGRERGKLIIALRQIIAAIDPDAGGKTLQESREVFALVIDGLQRGSPRDDAKALTALRDCILTKSMQPRTSGFSSITDLVAPLQDAWQKSLADFSFDFEAEKHAAAAAEHLARLFEPTLREYQNLCRERRQYDFLTLARAARDLLAHSPDARRTLKDRWQRFMVDEFQDTNWLQWEIISWLVGDGPDGQLDADRLFIVGDPQQSIYRFRNADVSVFGAVDEKIRAANQTRWRASKPTLYDAELGMSDGRRSTLDQRLGRMPLGANYRSLSPVPLELLDRVFAHTFDPHTHGMDPSSCPFEVSYQRLETGIEGKPNGEVRIVLTQSKESNGDSNGDESDGDGAGEGLPETDDVLAARAAVEELVRCHGKPRLNPPDGGSKETRWQDMAVLLPSRSRVLERLEKELARRRVPYTVSSGVGFWQRQEVRDLVNLAAALTDPNQEIALFAVLRSPLAQLTDMQILFLSQLGWGNLRRGLALALRRDPADESVGSLTVDPSAAAIWAFDSDSECTLIQEAADRFSNWLARVDRLAHADLLRRCFEESGALAIYASQPDGEIALANLDQAFAIIRDQDGGGFDLARVARRLRSSVDDELKAPQADVAAGKDAVRIMTVHAAKGLEFPVVVVMKTDRKIDQARRGQFRLQVVPPTGGLLAADAAKFPGVASGTIVVNVRHPEQPRAKFTPALLRALEQLDTAQDIAESRRLFYVAATRAEERLILVGKQGLKPHIECWQRWLIDALGLDVEHAFPGAETDQPVIWSDATGRLQATLVGSLPPALPLEVAPAAACEAPINTAYIHERPARPVISPSKVETFFEEFERDPDRWWLRHRKMLSIEIPRPIVRANKAGDSADDASAGKVIGALVHRWFQFHAAAQAVTPLERRRFMLALATTLLKDEEDAATAAIPVDNVVDTVLSIIDRIDSNLAGANAIRTLLEARGDAEVSFVLALGNWRVSGRFDKLMAVEGGYDVVDWKTDKDADVAAIAARHEMQMKLYALALAKMAQTPRRTVRAHLALLNPLVVHRFEFALDELLEWETKILRKLEEMDAYRTDASTE